MSQDILEDEEIKLDWFFKTSLMHDIANVSNGNCQLAGLLISMYRVSPILFWLKISIKKVKVIPGSWQSACR